MAGQSKITKAIAADGREIVEGARGHAQFDGAWAPVTVDRVFESGKIRVRRMEDGARSGSMVAIVANRFRHLTTGPLPPIDRSSLRGRGDGHAFQMNFTQEEWAQLQEVAKAQEVPISKLIIQALHMAGSLGDS